MQIDLSTETRLTLAVVSDTHGVLDPAVAERVAAADIAVHCGDIGSAAVLEALRPRRGQVIAVKGNNDIPEKWEPAGHEILAALPDWVEVRLPGGTLVVLHGDRLRQPVQHDQVRRRFPEARAVVYGHTHRLVCDTAHSPWVLNPGASGRARTFGGPSWLRLTVHGADWTVEAERFAPGARLAV